MKRIALWLLMLMLIVSVVSAQEIIETDEDALFGTAEQTESDEDVLFGTAEQTESDDGSLFEGGLVTDIEEKEEDLSTILLTAEGVEIGGRLRFEATSSWTYDGMGGPFGATLIDDPLRLDLGAAIYLDARPSETFRVFVKTDVSFPYDDAGGGQSFDADARVIELFSDFQLGDAVFFRAGKQTANWGVGYFFSPADLLNVTEIDSEDPEADLEGPIALKIHAPVGAHNLYLYTIFEDTDSAWQTALAPKVEFVIGDTEIGVGGFYRHGNAPAAMATLTTSVLNFELFAEGIVSYGSDKTFVVEDSPGVPVRTYDDKLFPSATAGFSYRYSDDLDTFNVSLSAQYLYNGEGYKDPDFLKNNAFGVAGLKAAGALEMTDLMDTGRHYGAVNVGWNELFASDFNLGCFWLGNLADGSGLITPSITWNILDDMNVYVKTSFRYGETGDEYTPQGDGMSLSLAFNFGGGGF